MKLHIAFCGRVGFYLILIHKIKIWYKPGVKCKTLVLAAPLPDYCLCLLFYKIVSLATKRCSNTQSIRLNNVDNDSLALTKVMRQY